MGRRSQLQSSLSQPSSRVVLVAKAIVCFFPGNNVEEEEDEKEKVEENENRSTMQSSVAMPQSCSLGIKQLFHSFQ